MLVDPTGFREIVAANQLLFIGVNVILAMGGMLFLLGFLGCCGAIRENKCLLLFVSTFLKAQVSKISTSKAAFTPENLSQGSCVHCYILYLSFIHTFGLDCTPRGLGFGTKLTPHM